MDAEGIVRALAAKDAPLDPEVFDCILCRAGWVAGTDPELQQDPQRHAPECPWRLAREWAAAHPPPTG